MIAFLTFRPPNDLSLPFQRRFLAEADLEGGVGGKSGLWGRKPPLPQWGPGAKSRQGVWGRRPPEAGAFF